MAGKFTFQCTSDDRRRPLPHKVLFGLGQNESSRHVVLKFLAWVLFFRERLQIETDVQNDAIPFVPDLAQLGYDMRPLLWVECGDCSLLKLHKLAVKCPEAEIWAVKRSLAEAEELLRGMAKEELRRGRYGIIGFEGEMVDELCGLLRERNQFHWFSGGFAGEPGVDQCGLQFELNQLWFDHPFHVLRN